MTILVTRILSNGNVRTLKLYEAEHSVHPTDSSSAEIPDGNGRMPAAGPEDPDDAYYSFDWFGSERLPASSKVELLWDAFTADGNARQHDDGRLEGFAESLTLQPAIDFESGECLLDFAGNRNEGALPHGSDWSLSSNEVLLYLEHLAPWSD